MSRTCGDCVLSSCGKWRVCGCVWNPAATPGGDLGVLFSGVPVKLVLVSFSLFFLQTYPSINLSTHFLLFVHVGAALVCVMNILSSLFFYSLFLFETRLKRSVHIFSDLPSLCLSFPPALQKTVRKVRGVTSHFSALLLPASRACCLSIFSRSTMMSSSVSFCSCVV